MKHAPSNINEEIYQHIVKNNLIDEFIVSSGSDLVSFKNLIKEETVLYIIENDLLFELNLSNKIFDTVKTVYWSVTPGLWTGKIALSNWLSGIGFNIVTNKSIGLNSFGGTLVTGILKKLNPSQAASAATSLSPANILLSRAINVAIFPSILLGLLIYRLIKFSHISDIKNFELTVSSILVKLNLRTKKKFKNINKELNSKFETVLKNNCSNISDKKESVKCASNFYVKYITEVVLIELITEYVLYLKKNNNDIRYIETFYELSHYQFSSNTILTKYFNMIYTYYYNILKNYVFNDALRKRYISLLDTHTRKEVRKK